MSVYIMTEDEELVMMNNPQEGYPLMQWEEVEEKGLEALAVFQTEYNDVLQQDCVVIFYDNDEWDIPIHKKWTFYFNALDECVYEYGDGERELRRLVTDHSCDWHIIEWQCVDVNTKPEICTMYPSPKPFMFVPAAGGGDGEYVLK